MPDEIEQRRYVNDTVVGRFPSGTDPRHAIRAVLGVGLERTDGGNEMPWWLTETWWHGGPDGIRVGEDISPPSLTGMVPHIDGSDRFSVYVTRNREDALLYACWHRSPMLYEVTFSGEPSDDDVVIGDPDSFRVPKATVRRLHGLTRPELEAALNRTFENGVAGVELEP